MKSWPKCETLALRANRPVPTPYEPRGENAIMPLLGRRLRRRAQAEEFGQLAGGNGHLPHSEGRHFVNG